METGGLPTASGHVRRRGWQRSGTIRSESDGGGHRDGGRRRHCSQPGHCGHDVARCPKDKTYDDDKQHTKEALPRRSDACCSVLATGYGGGACTRGGCVANGVWGGICSGGEFSYPPPWRRVNKRAAHRQRTRPEIPPVLYRRSRPSNHAPWPLAPSSSRPSPASPPKHAGGGGTMGRLTARIEPEPSAPLGAVGA